MSSPDDEATAKLNEARQHYYAHITPSGDMAAAKWLILYRNVKTDKDARIYAYNPEEGHYNREGEMMLKADLIREFGQHANRTRVGEILAKVQALSYTTDKELEGSIPPRYIPLNNFIYDIEDSSLYG